MKPEIKQAWIDALRSNKYPQGKNRLLGEDGYCCLGVLCALHNDATNGPGVMVGDQVRECYFGQSSVLPRQVVEWAGLSDDIPSVVCRWNDDTGVIAPGEGDGTESTQNMSLIELNDDYSWNFNKIATAIEAEKHL